MSEKHSTKPLRAVAYYRCSSLKQVDSIDRQKSQVEPEIDTLGYVPVGVYEEPGIPGDEFERRPALQRLLRDAKARKFDVIVVDELSRLSRQDVISFIMTIIGPLRDAGVKLHTVEQGPVDWENLVGLLMLTIKQDKSSTESPALARRVLTQMLELAKSGANLGGKHGYGYCLDWSLDGHKAVVARTIFELYDSGKTLGGVARELHQRGVASPTGRPFWSRGTLRDLLVNKTYAGFYRWGENARGKFLATKKGKIRLRSKDETRASRNVEADQIYIPDHHTPIVPLDLFQRVQARMARNKRSTAPHADGGPFLLTGLLFCHLCGSSMTGAHNKTHQRVYFCSGYHEHGPAFCRKQTVQETVLVPLLIQKLQEEFLAPEHLQALREEAVCLEETEHSPQLKSSLRTEAAQLAAKVEKAVARLASGGVDDDNLAAVNEHVRKLRQQQAAVLAELGRVETSSPRRDLEEQIQAMEAALWDLQNALQAEDTPLLREVLQALFERVTLRFDNEQVDGKWRSRLVGGVLVLRDGRSQEISADLSNPACRYGQVFTHTEGRRIDFRLDGKTA